jgi:hypothetical protein
LTGEFEMRPFFMGKIYSFFILVSGFILAGGRSVPQHHGAPPAPHILVLHFKATVHGQPLLLRKNYADPRGDSFELDMFRFYAGKIKILPKGSPENNTLSRGSGRPSQRSVSPAIYHLVDLSDPASTVVVIPVAEGDYDQIRFQLGIDSADQTGGAKTGALDPLKGMFWTWNSGYIAFKMEGRSPASVEPAHAFSYHIGGYRSPYRIIRTLTLRLADRQMLHISAEGTTHLEIPVELDRFFDGKTKIRIKEIPACTTPGALALRIFENFTGAFEQVEIK